MNCYFMSKNKIFVITLSITRRENRYELPVQKDNI